MAVNMGIGTTDVSEPAFTPGGTRRRQVRARFTGGGGGCLWLCGSQVKFDIIIFRDSTISNL